MPSLKKARAVAKGATVGIAAPAGPIDPERLEAGEDWLRALGFEPHRRDDVTARRAYLAGEDARRAAELMELVEDPDVGAIVCARGGYGCHRIVPLLDAEKVRRARKPLVGYSDITTLHLWQRRAAGLMSIHGPMLEKTISPNSETSAALVRALTGTGALPRMAGRSLCGGWAEGRLVGGNLAVVAASVGTPWAPDPRGAILMFEDLNEPLYKLDRLLVQLRAAGLLEGLAGIGIGCLQDCEGGSESDWGLEELLRDTFEPLGVPVVCDLPFGHGAANLAWSHGARAALDGDRGELELLEAAVAAR